VADDINALELATELTVAWLSNPNTRAGSEDVPAFLSRMHQAVDELAAPAAPTAEEPAGADYTPAVSVRKSLASKDHIISMLDGKPYKALRRHLSANGLTPEQYRERYSLKPDYPMVAKGYSEARRAVANKIGLGRKPRSAAAAKLDAASAPDPNVAAPMRRRKAAPAG
jgi:predicted transcriptional regulator